MEFNEQYNCYLEEFNRVLNAFCEKLDCKPDVLAESMKYSLTIGGKRIRPVLMLACADLLGLERRKVHNFALATELIHTYSLIHDDLPEMDNDDFRRGKPSNHKVFGAGNAILAGDALLNTAYSLLLRECKNGVEYISASECICDCAGAYGMIAGQSADLKYENERALSENVLNFIYDNKTAKMIVAPVSVPSILCGGRCYSELTAFGRDLGLLFQVTDDILDVEGEFDKLGKSIGKDSVEGKYTSVALYGLDGSKLRADVLAERCRTLLEGIDGDREFMLKFVDYVRNRKN